QDRFYGDNRDLVKWGTLLELARTHKAKQILLVLYYRPNEWDRRERRYQWAPIEIGGQIVEIAPEVIRHFREVNLIRNLKSPVPIDVLKGEFGDRRKYLDAVKAAIRTRSDYPGIVFLDPDTGLEPPGGNHGPKHVLCDELSEIWESLATGDVLVLYQHKTAMNNAPFIEPKIQQFVDAIGIPREREMYAYAPMIARDVAFFFAQKE
ncbi:MAG TPA: hypothetical protein VGE83_02420, partial [Terracidiphilus sp.]